MDSPCDTHPDAPSLAQCSRCARPFCDPCLPALVDGLCACAGCAAAERAQTGRPWGFAAVVLIACGLGSFAFARAEIRATGEPTWALYGFAGILAVAFASFVVSRKRVGLRVEPREPGNVPEDTRGAGGPYRDMARAAPAPRRLPPLSGRLTAFTLFMCFAFCALSAPFALHLPRWVEVEIVFGAGWLVWTAVLAAILYRGQRIADDHRFDPSLWFAKRKEAKASKVPKTSGGGGSWFDGWSFGGDLGGIGDAGEGCLVILGAVLLAGAAILTAWLLVELVIPAVFTLAYLLLIRALKVATNDQSGCQGDLTRSLGRGALYATLFAGPLLVVVAVVHMVAKKSGVF